MNSDPLLLSVFYYDTIFVGGNFHSKLFLYRLYNRRIIYYLPLSLEFHRLLDPYIQLAMMGFYHYILNQSESN